MAIIYDFQAERIRRTSTGSMLALGEQTLIGLHGRLMNGPPLTPPEHHLSLLILKEACGRTAISELKKVYSDAIQVLEGLK